MEGMAQVRRILKNVTGVLPGEKIMCRIHGLREGMRQVIYRLGENET